MGITYEGLKKIISEMGINKAIIIDDKYEKDKSGKLVDVLNGNFDTKEFSAYDEVSSLGLNLEDVIQDAQEGKLNDEVLDMCRKKLPDLFKSELDSFIDVLTKIFDSSSLIIYNKTSEIELDKISEDTILFLDYQLEDEPPYSSEILAKVLTEKNTASPRCIVFISNSPNFYINEEAFNMSKPVEKSRYIRELRRSHNQENLKNSLFDFIDKKLLKDEMNILKLIDEVLQNLYGGKIFYGLLDQINNILQQSSREVLNQFHLLNARSIQELILSKIEREGISEHVFLMEWISRNIAKSVLRNDSAIKDINSSLNNICRWSQPFNELHEDVALQEILLSEMWDKSIKCRYEPISFGDVFELEIDGLTRKALLLTQPCTLAVRGDGTRSGTVGMFVLHNEAKKKSSSPSILTVTDWAGEELILNFDETITFCLDLLDLTTLNSNGQASITYIKEKGKAIWKKPNAIWSKGYSKMLDELSKKIFDRVNASTKFHPNHGFMQLNQTWTPFDIKKAIVNNFEEVEFEFPIKRISRLDYQYALYVFQRAQSWWGRIGLPVNLNFMEDYKVYEGKVCINNNDEVPIGFLVKKEGNDIRDIGVETQSLMRVIENVYEPKNNVNLLEEINLTLNEKNVTRISCASGKNIISLREDLGGIDLLRKNRILFKLNDDSHQLIKLDILVARFRSVLLNETDCTADIKNIYFDSKGDITVDISSELLKDFSFLRENHKTKQKFMKKDNSEIFRISSDLWNIFDVRVQNDVLYIGIKKEIVKTEGEVAAAKRDES